MEMFELIARILATLTGLLHVWIFVMESILWMRPTIFKRFGVATKEQAALLKDGMLNQGFYNLFLALGSLAGAALFSTYAAAPVLLLYANASIAAAGLVLIVSKPKLLKAGLIQGLPALLAVTAGFLSM